MDGAQLIALLETPTDDRRPTMWELREAAPADALIDALRLAERPHTRQLVADILGFRAEPSAVDALLAALYDPESGVRSAVADALGKILLAYSPRDARTTERAGVAMLARFEAEDDPGVRRMLASAVGTTGYRPAAPALRAALESDDKSLAFCAGWGLHWLEGTPPPSLPM
jgi:HEAT repeat protein